jgi:quinol monooxygenase YgiN
VYRSLEDENNVTIIGTVEDPAVMRQMFDNPEMQQIMEQAGVISKPEMMVLREA